VQTGRKQRYAVVHSAESLQEWVNQLRIRYRGEARRRCPGAGAWRIDPCFDPHGFH
jgi:hypothetical protein